MPAAPQFTNRLIREKSLYLRQHAHNSVDWYPWGAEALQRARQLNRPIFLSIGYSACHWCHVMERESFEDPEIGRLLNEHFVSIKVDREERPDLDQVYMIAVQMLTGQGGWPMSLFLTPDLKPFWGGTYFPPQDHYGRPGFRRVLLSIADSWKNQRQSLISAAADLIGHLQGQVQLESAPGELDDDLLRQAARNLERVFDDRYGGFGRAPKFPHPIDLRLLLRVARRFADETSMRMARFTLEQMAMGGTYDHLGGGFHRYSTDQRWLVPHFEKMLYDNALLSCAYLEAFQITREPFFRTVVEETLAYVLREMTSPEGPFYSTQDADSEGEEGRFYVWSADAVERVLGRDTAEVFAYVYDVSREGNWEGHNILHRSKTLAQCAALLKIPEPGLTNLLAQARRQLLEARRGRIRPARDEKVLTSWNALMITGLAQASQVLENPSYAEAAMRAADFILQNMRSPKGLLFHCWNAGSEPRLNAYLDDYAYLVDALVTLYETTFQLCWLESALEVADVLVDQFWDETEGGFNYTGKNHESLLVRTKDAQDSATPSGNSLAVLALLRLAKLTGRADLGQKAEKTLQLFRGLMADSPQAVSQMLLALDFYIGPVQEVAVVGDPAHEETRRVWRVLRSRFRPHQVVAFKPVSGDNSRAEALIPLLAGKMAQGPVTTFICRDFTCRQPLVGARAVETAQVEGDLSF